MATGFIYPERLEQFFGKERLKKRIRTHIMASLKKKEPFPHTLLYGPPGLGKTAIPRVVASEMGVGFKYISAPSLSKVGHIISVLVNLEENDILLLDEIHRLPRAVEEILYKVMDDGKVSVIIGSGVSGKVVDINIPSFTLFGTTTMLHRVSSPLRSRFQIVERLDFYSPSEMLAMAKFYSESFSLKLPEEVLKVITWRSRGTPRNLVNLLKNLRDFILAEGIDGSSLTLEKIEEFFRNFGVYEYGLTSLDMKYIEVLLENFSGGPVGIETLSSALGEEPSSIESEVEPFLMRMGFIRRTRRGRVVTSKGLSFYKGFQSKRFLERL